MAFGFIVVVYPKNQLIEKADAGDYLRVRSKHR
ncbi:MAG: hypothetical protein ACJA0U_001063 [Salibacteraceae bacterium]|jgi:hypothetical protein